MKERMKEDRVKSVSLTFASDTWELVGLCGLPGDILTEFQLLRSLVRLVFRVVLVGVNGARVRLTSSLLVGTQS